MIGELAELIEAFPGAANQTRCFLHIINRVAKSVLRQFEPNARHKDLLSEGAKELAALTENLEGSIGEHSGNDEDLDEAEDDEAEDDTEEGGECEHEGMSDQEVVTLEESVQPVRLVLAKVSD